MPTTMHFPTPVEGHDTLDLPAYSFLVENAKAHKKVLFDLGIMKAWKEKRPDLADRAQSINATFEVLADVSELLTNASIPLSSIDSIIWSNHHVDHTGDASLFPSTTSLIVGPGFKTNPSTYPGFPHNPDGHVFHTAFEGRDLIELDFNRTTGVLKVGGLRAIDWFDDGSLYLLEAPGPTPEHIMALARTSVDKFVLLAGDAATHPGVIRPSQLRPLPETIAPNSSSALLARGPAFRTTPIYEPLPYPMQDPVRGRSTIAAVQAFDASEDVLVVLSHDPSFREFTTSNSTRPSLTRWEEPRGEDLSNRKDAVYWRFLADFRKSVEV